MSESALAEANLTLHYWKYDVDSRNTVGCDDVGGGGVGDCGM